MLPIHPGRFGHRAAHAPVAYEAESTTYFAAMSVAPDDARKGLINTLIAGLKSDGIWTKLDWLCLLAAHDEQAGRLNAVSTGQTLTAVNSPTFTTDRGFAGDGATAYMDFGVTAGSGAQYDTDSCSRGLWINLGSGTALVTVFGDNTSSFRGAITARNSAGNETFRASDSTSDTSQANPGTKTGHRYWSRTASAVKRAFYNGTRVADLTTASTGLAATNARLMGHNTPASADRMAACWMGGGLTDTEANNLHSRLSTYLTAIGAN